MAYTTRGRSSHPKVEKSGNRWMTKEDYIKYRELPPMIRIDLTKDK